MVNSTGGNGMEPLQKTVKSSDGTTIAYEQSGTGPAIILVDPALSDRGGTVKLGKLLASAFTVISYDRRGRGKSTDTAPYAIQREVEDIEALIDAAGGSAYLFGSSSGAALALEAAARLGDKVKGLLMYEPPFIIDDSRPPVADNFGDEVKALVAADRRNDAVRLFFHKAIGIPAVFVTLMRLLMPGWSQMVGIAHTIPYDVAVLAGTQSGKPLPADRWASATAPTLVMVGSKSEVFFHSGAKALVDLLLNAQYRSLEGRDHGAVMMAPKDIAAAINAFAAEGRSHASHKESTALSQ
jgi:pimeloyl-ACP methyl ester carboxylesterase